MVELNPTENTIKFNEVGAYEIEFTFNGYCSQKTFPFDIDSHFVSVGFRAINSDNVYIGANDWSFSEAPHNVKGLGIINVEDSSVLYELVNLHKSSLMILGGNKQQTLTNSYYSTPIVTLIIKKLRWCNDLKGSRLFASVLLKVMALNSVVMFCSGLMF